MEDEISTQDGEDIMYNSTESPKFEFTDYTQRVVVAVMYLIVTVLGIFGNSMVILAVLLSKRLRTATNAFVVNLSIADLLTCFALPWSVAATLSTDGLPVGEWLCSMAAVVQSTAIGCSLYMLASIGLQRLLLITRPMTTYRLVYTPRKIAALLVLTWLVPLLITILPPLLDVGAVGYNHKYHHCGFPSNHPRSNDYDLIIAGGLYPLPLITILVCYILIWRHLRRHVKKVGAPEASVESMATNATRVSVSVVTADGQHIPRPAESSTLRRISRRQYEITKNMFYIVCAFMLCLTPFAICLFYDDSDPVLPYASAILFFNSCINPLIYATKHRDFKTVFCCIWRRRWDNIPEPSEFLKFLRNGQCCGRSGLYA